MKKLLNGIAKNCQSALLTSGYNRVVPVVSNKKMDSTKTDTEN